MSVPGSVERRYVASAAQSAQATDVVGNACSGGFPSLVNQSRACRWFGRKATTSCPSFASAFGSDPQTSPSPPVLAMGETSAVAKRILMSGFASLTGFQPPQPSVLGPLELSAEELFRKENLLDRVEFREFSLQPPLANSKEEFCE